MRKLTVGMSGVLQWLRGPMDQGRALGDDRGDISITTVIIWVAAVAGALLIAGTIAVVVSRYNGMLTGI
ncbi:hypothetical protein ABZ516_31375 [Streptomyces sp. NPDC019826]|uniref:hypothetical protein n=1 Tax=unclassified Streptomyces TaxID=2593676 RepID=UPI0034035294